MVRWKSIIRGVISPQGPVFFESGYPVGVFFKGCEIFSEKIKGCEIFSENFKGSENNPVPERIRGNSIVLK